MGGASSRPRSDSNSLPERLHMSQYCSSGRTEGGAESGSWSDTQSWASSVLGRWDNRHRSDRFSCCASFGSGCRPCWREQSAPWGWSRPEPDRKEGGPPECEKSLQQSDFYIKTKKKGILGRRYSTNSFINECYSYMLLF